MGHVINNGRREFFLKGVGVVVLLFSCKCKYVILNVLFIYTEIWRPDNGS